MHNKKWPLNINNISQQYREDISTFILDADTRWTQDIQVKLIEKEFAEYAGSRYAVFTSSGSTANTILAQYTRDKLGNDPEKNVVIFPSTTWQTSCSPWIREGFNPVFIDISLSDFSIDTQKLLDYIEANQYKIACVFPTSLIGYVPNIEFYQNIQTKYQIPIMFDNCENTLGEFSKKNISSYFTSTTSTYFGHQIQSVEGGLIFTNSQIEYEYFLMLRNHGMTRSLLFYNLPNDNYINRQVDSLFDFYCLGSNYRNTDIHAFIGRKDLSRAKEYYAKRKHLYSIYKDTLDRNKYYLPETRINCQDIPFCLAIIPFNKTVTVNAINMCRMQNIEYRPIISGFLGFQTAYKKYFSHETETDQYKNSIFLHNNGFYVGLHTGLNDKDIIELTSMLNNL
jgi:CDP-6-deoxy-D-xylo-4-hexulose-3-dehydrase